VFTVLVIAIAAAPAAAHAADAQRALARRYAPVVRLVEQTKRCATGEPFQPTYVSLVLGNPDVALRGPWDRTSVIKVGPTAEDLGRGLFAYHLDFPGDALTPGCSYGEWSHRLNRGHPSATYARVVTDSKHPDQLVLQYWFFYVFNDFNDKHEGDWEMIQLDFDAATAREALGRRPTIVGYSQHQGAESAHWGDPKLQLVGGTHPVVYPARGSHANYFTSALHLGRSAAQGVGCDDTSAPSRELQPQVAVVPSGKTAYLRAYPWLGFDGYWGEDHDGFYNGPTGPNTKLQWTHPITWANHDWRDKSFTVPIGIFGGQTATGFFCGAVGTGSSLLTAVAGNTSPMLIVFGVILALLLWLVSRTTWRPSAPLRLQRRRTWGSIAASARRMYFGHLRLFLGIGLLFLPLGALITGFQYLTFQAGGLDGLVAGAGRSNAVVDFLVFGLGLFVTVFGLAVVESATALAMREIDEGRQVTAPGAYRKALPTLSSLLSAVLPRGRGARAGELDRNRNPPRHLAGRALVAAGAGTRAGGHLGRRRPAAKCTTRAGQLVARSLPPPVRDAAGAVARAALRDALALRDQRVVRLHQPLRERHRRDRASVRGDRHHLPLLRPPRRSAG
jgi:hypothetical protein